MSSLSDGKHNPPKLDKQLDKLPEREPMYWYLNMPGQAETPGFGMKLFEARYRLLMGTTKVRPRSQETT
jgi:hypothetical protein